MKLTSPSPIKALGQGRPAQQEQDPRAALIWSARQKFIRKSFDKVSIREIAALAGVNSALIKYYFQNKEGLYKAMILEVTGEVMADFKTHLQASPFDSLESFFRSFFNVMQQSPEFPLLMLKEVILDQGICREFFLEQLGHSHVKIFDQIYIQLNQQGKLRANIDPLLFRTSLMGAMIFPFYIRDLMQKMEGVIYDDAFFEQLIKHNALLMQCGFFKGDSGV
ncbi:TetR/AcrR family transcriptional regulator [Pseudoalteromonas tunicata]|uniref:TetR/AcrR family transcriptional regulator n=1 Tax=Pseudoalteromonas tunicata TaxID=314281 RepID=UPI00273E07A1|nr:TetR/AcrR family transcriptional regulator [Pseudoalteromonas tunicata]MDP4983089.1 TetR/AcrR family transcriptional regulator [Pseudoalteromonas tunicata]MDP5214747.1 TetR/AcrR family transcriptional regulator [Pseudoalteromonas tunicata]